MFYNISLESRKNKVNFEIDIENAIMYYNLLRPFLEEMSNSIQSIEDSSEFLSEKAFISYFKATEEELKEFIESCGRFKVCGKSAVEQVCNNMELSGVDTCVIV